jgi:hypothetical protein
MVANGGLPLNQGESVELLYDGSVSRWRVLANTYT